MSVIREGTHALETLVSDVDGSTAYRYTGVVSSWEDAMREPADDVEWSVEPDDDRDDAEVSMPVDQWARLVRLARVGRLYEGCAACKRVEAV